MKLFKKKNTGPKPSPAPGSLKSLAKPRSWVIVTWLWILAGLFMVGILTFFILVYNGVIGYMPPVEELKNPADRFASIIYSADGQEMGRYYRNTGNRVYADYDEISQHLVDALVATEDVRYEDHSGIDARALSRVAVKNLFMGDKSAGGGSTITQQLAKQLYSPESDGGISRAMQKPIEWMIAIKLERFYSKEEIIKMYFNQFDFLYNAVGIKSAAQVYFNKDPRNLNIQESALLVGMVKNPAYYNPVRNPQRALDRRNTVLDQMVKAGKLSRADADSIKKLPIELDFHRVDHKDGIAPYFREELRRYLTAKRPERGDYPSWDYARYRTDSVLWATNPLYGWAEKNPKADGSLYDIYNDGLRIYTTIDSRMQAYAEQAMDEHMQDLQKRFFKEKKGSAAAPYTSNTAELPAATRLKLISNAMSQSERGRVARLRGLTKEQMDKEFDTPVSMTLFTYSGPVDTVMTPRDSILYVKSYLRSGFMAMDPRNGHVKAYVGGPDFKFFQYDMVSQGKRQVGSTMKPYLYTLALEDGMSPCTQMLNSPPTIRLYNGRTWTPRGSYSGAGEMIDLRRALTQSNNWISARLITETTPQRLVDYMESFGITSRLDPVPALCLGSSEISLREMVGAYSAFANKGMRTDPIYVTAIADNNGNIISRFAPNQTEVISEKAYWRILSMLLNVVDSGTGSRIRSRYGITAQMGGKTGTTNYNADGWFMGFTPEIVAGTWVGGDERYIHFNTMRDGQGAEMALPIFGKFMQKVYGDKTLPYSQSEKFNFPPAIPLCDYVAADPAEDEEEVTVDESVFD